MSDTDQAEPIYDDIPEHWRVAAPGSSIYDAAELIEPPADADAPGGPGRMSDEERIALAQRLAEEYAQRTGTNPDAASPATDVTGPSARQGRRRGPLFVVTALVLSAGAGAGIAALATRDGDSRSTATPADRSPVAPDGGSRTTLPGAAASAFDPVIAASATTAPGNVVVDIERPGGVSIVGTVEFGTGMTSAVDGTFSLLAWGDTRQLSSIDTPDAPAALQGAGVRYQRGEGMVAGIDEAAIEASLGPNVPALIEAIRQGRPGGQGPHGGTEVIIPAAVADPGVGSGEFAVEVLLDDEHRIIQIMWPAPPNSPDTAPTEIRLTRAPIPSITPPVAEPLSAHPEVIAYLAERFPLG